MAIASVVCAAQMQARTIQGVVVDAGTGEEVIGATVMPQGGGQGVATDFDGKFTLNVPDNVKTARISAVGYKEQVVKLTPSMRIELASTAATLDDVVVIGYGTATKESLTGSVAVVGAKEIEDRPVTNVATALEGNAPGVQVNSTTSAPGSSPSIVIRGVGTLTGSTAPQLVVDGVIFGGGLADINPADVESMTVLKDAASCAIYGVRGSNGVILITTKRAKNKGKADVTLQVREGMYTRGLPEYKHLTPNEWMETQFQTQANELMASAPARYPDRATANAYWQKNFIDGFLQGHNIYNLPNDQLFDENGKILGQVLPGYTDLDWWDAVARTGLRQEYNLNVTAGAEKYNMFASIGYLKEDGYIRNSDFERFNGRFNVDFQPTTYLRAGVNLNASYQKSNGNIGSGTEALSNPFRTQFYAPIFPYYEHDAEGNIVYDEAGQPMWNMRGMFDNRNSAFEMRKNKAYSDGATIDANVFATAIIPYGFELTIRGNMNRSFSHATNYYNKWLGDASPVGRLIEANYQDRQHSFMQYLNWRHSYGNENWMHNIDVIMGHENTSAYGAAQSATMLNQIEDDYYAFDNFLEAQGVPSGSYSEARSESYLARGRYNLNDTYFAEASIRRDGSDRFSPDNRWGTFWSVGASWIFSKEKFMHSLEWVNYAKLRLSYGSVGNYASAPMLAYKSLYFQTTYDNQPMLVRGSIGNPLISWEAQKTLDVAIEGTLFNNRLNFSIGYFDKASSDLIYEVSTPLSKGNMPFAGSTMTIPTNIGKISNRGWEISFNGTLMRNENINWTASLDMTFIKNKVNKLPYGDRDVPNGLQRWSVGRSRYAWYLPTFVGVDQMTGNSLYAFEEEEYKYYRRSSGIYTDEQLEELWQEQVQNAASSLVTINGKTYTTQSSYATDTWHGDAMPVVYGSFGTNLQWKNVSFGILFTYSLGGKVLDAYYQSMMSVSGKTSQFHKDVLKAWTGVPEGMTEDSPNRIDPNGVPVNNSQLSLDNNASSSRFLTDASWLVLKNINVNYTLPEAWTRVLQLQSISIGFSADNLFTVAKRKGLNPSMTYSGQQDSSTPGFMTNRIFSFQLTARF